jgi:hypothetical protein
VSKADNVSYVDFQKKKNVTEQDIYNSWYDKWLDIKRACDPSKTIAHEAITFIATLEFLFTKNPDEIIFNKELLTKKCKQGPRQRSRFLAQLADIYKITPHTSYNYKGKKYHFIYSAKRTENSLAILKNPQEFFKNRQSKMTCIEAKSDLYTSQKCLVSKSNLTSTYTANPSSIQGMQEHRNIIETNIETDLLDLCSSKDNSLCIEGKNLKNQDTNFIFSNQTELEANTEFHNMSRVDRMIAKEQARREKDALEGNSFDEVLARAKAKRDQEQLALTKQQETIETEQQEPIPDCESLEVARLELAQDQGQQTDIHTKNGHVYHANRLLNEFDFTDELIDAVREKSDKPHFPNSRIIAIMRNIVASNPKVRIWGGRQAFINYMVKAVNNEKEFTKEEKAQSLAEIKKKEAEQLLYDFEHRVIRYF